MGRLEVMQKVRGRKLSVKEASRMLGITDRQIKRLTRAYREKGVEGLISKRRGQPSSNRLSAEDKQEAVELLKAHYADFGPQLAKEK